MINIFGLDLLVLRKWGERVAGLGRTTQGIVDVRGEQQLQNPQRHIQPNYSAIASHGMGKDTVMQRLRWRNDRSRCWLTRNSQMATPVALKDSWELRRLPQG